MKLSLLILLILSSLNGCSLFDYEWEKGKSPPKGHINSGIEGCKFKADVDFGGWEEVRWECKWNNKEFDDLLRGK